MTLTLAQARSILDKTLAAAREKKFRPLGVAVVDSRGALRAYAEEDGQHPARPGAFARFPAAKAFAVRFHKSSTQRFASERTGIHRQTS